MVLNQFLLNEHFEGWAAIRLRPNRDGSFSKYSRGICILNLEYFNNMANNTRETTYLC